MSVSNKRKFHFSEQEWAGLVNSRQQLDQPVFEPTVSSSGALDLQAELEYKRQIVQQQAAEISRLRWQVRHLEAQCKSQGQPSQEANKSASNPQALAGQLEPSSSRTSSTVALAASHHWADMTPAWQNVSLGIRPWQAQPPRSQRRMQVELPNFARR